MKSTSILNSGIYAARPKKINKHIQIVSSTLLGLGSMSKSSRQAAYDVLQKHYSRVGITIVNSLADLEGLVALQPDLIFLGMKYIPVDPNNRRGPDRIWLTTYFDERDIAYTGSDQSAHQIELDKSLAKQCILDAGLNTAPFYIAKQNRSGAECPDLSFPLFVKPTDRGGGQGIDSDSVARNPVALKLKIDRITTDLQADSLVEEYLPGREFSVAVLKNEFGDQFSVMPVELVAQADKHGQSLMSKEVKSSNSEVATVVTDKTIRDSICQLALASFHALGGRDYGRIDIRLDAADRPHFLEANLLPSLIDGYGSFPKACLLNIGLNHEDMILAIAALGLERDYRAPIMGMPGTGQTLEVETAGIVPVV